MQFDLKVKEHAKSIRLFDMAELNSPFIKWASLLLGQLPSFFTLRHEYSGRKLVSQRTLLPLQVVATMGDFKNTV